MSEEELELRITLDDPGEEDLEEDTFHENTSQPFSATKNPGQRTDIIVDKDRS